MSDFFGDDFTAELKSFFLNNLLLEIDKFIDLTDEKLWRRIYLEACEQMKVWAVDAKTNEFEYLAQWLEAFEVKSKNINDETEFISYLKVAKSYVETLLEDKTDSEELAARFILNSQSRKEIKLLHCWAGKHEFAVPILSIIEISTGHLIYSLPQAREGILGVIPYRGEVVPVVNLSDYGFSYTEEEEKNCFVICEQNGLRFSLPISRTEDMLDVKESELQNIDETSSVVSVPFAHQFFIKNERSIMILDLTKLVA